MGEGAGTIVLEELDHALERGVRHIYGEVLGYGMSGDAHHITQPATGGHGAVRAMRAALRHAGLSPDSVDYVNCHATSTPLGDAAECSALAAVFGPAENGAGQKQSTVRQRALYVSSTKGATGHLLGAAGAVEAAYTLLALHHGNPPPTANLEHLDPELEHPGLLEFLVPPSNSKLADTGAQTGEETSLRAPKIAMSNSFGFGGTNASLVFAAWDQDAARKRRIAEILARHGTESDTPPTQAEMDAFVASVRKHED